MSDTTDAAPKLTDKRTPPPDLISPREETELALEVESRRAQGPSEQHSGESNS